MNCRETRTLLTANTGNDAVRDHLETCAECARFAARADAVRAALRDHHAGVEPDPGFAIRVSEALPRQAAADALGWAASRVLPAVLALAVVLGWAAMTAGDRTATVAEEIDGPTDDVLAWVLEPEEDPS